MPPCTGPSPAPSGTRGRRRQEENIAAIEDRLPWTLRGLHPDSGSEFINWHLKGWCEQHAPPVAFSRSEPYRKNDNMYVEERNGHVVRKYLGYTRLDCPEVVPILNELYDVLALFLNHWRAVRRTRTKERQGAKYVRTYEPRALTPYQRALAHPAFPETEKGRLRAKHETLNPLLLLRQIATLRETIFTIQRAARDRDHIPEVR